MSKKSILIIVISALVLIGTVLGIVLGVTASRQPIAKYSMKKLSKYVYVPEELYRSYNVTVDIAEITDSDVDEQVIKILRANKSTPKDEDGKDVPMFSKLNVNISAGDIAHIYYRGYILENGEKVYFDGGCNFGDTESYPLEIGSGKFVPGFESGLVGRNPDKQKYSDIYATVTHRKTGFVEADDIVTIEYSVMRTDNTMQQNLKDIIDLSDPDIDKKWGVGFKEFLEGKAIDSGKTLHKIEESDGLFLPTICEGESGEDLYHNITIIQACKVNKSVNEPLIVEVDFPMDYDEAEELKGKHGYFEVYVKGVQDYVTPEFDEKFITETLKINADSVKEYPGETLVDKYKAYIKEALNLTRDQNIIALKEDTFWKQVIAGSEFKKLPEREVEKYYDSMILDLTRAFDSNAADTQFAEDFDGYARYVLGLSTADDWRAAVRKDAEDAVKEKLVFYYIVKKEGFKQPEDEHDASYEAIFNEHMQDYLDFYSITEATPDYEKELKKARKAVLSTYGKEYFEELVLYDYVMGIIVSRAVVQ